MLVINTHKNKDNSSALDVYNLLGLKFIANKKGKTVKANDYHLVDSYHSQGHPIAAANTDVDNTENASCSNDLAKKAAEQYGSQLRTYFYNRLRSHNDVDDLLQELYCRLLTYDDPLRIKSLKSFVFTIALNLLRDKSRRTVTKMATKMTSLDEAEEIPAPTTDPTRIIEGIDELVQAVEIIEELQPSYKKAFYLHRVYGLSHKEIAFSMGVTVSMVEKYIMAAIKSYRSALATMSPV